MTESYIEFRQKFLAAAKGALTSLKIPGTGSAGEELFQDYCYFDFGSEKTLVHLSGVHGVEGFIGSLLQHNILSELDEVKSANANLLFVHAINPFGMSWARRFNAHNVDLNRNGWDFSLAPPKADSLFRDLHQQTFTKLLWAGISKGPGAVAQAIAGGQYEYPDQVFYGGRSLQFELQVFLRQVQILAPKTKKWVFIDVHTGLGKFAAESLFITGPAESLSLAETPALYKAQGDLGQLLARGLGADCTHVTQEFGTYSSLKVLFGLIAENRNFKTVPDQSLMPLFFPKNEDWRSQVLKSGRKRYFQILESL